MAKCLYVLKLSLLQHQIPSFTAQTKKKINTMSSFILHFYIRYWFTSPSLTGAASNDLKMYQDLTTFKRVSKAVSDASSKYFRDTPDTSQRSASPLLSAILPWRQKPVTSLLGRLEDCHLPQSRSESLPSPPSPHLAPCQTSWVLVQFSSSPS